MQRGEKIVAWFLGILLGMCFVIVTLGGYVRLSGSGLAIPEWPFFTIAINEMPDGRIVKEQTLWPPTSEQGWLTLKDTFKRDVPGNWENLSVGAFKRMFWIEWGHRAVAKAIGLVYLIFLGLALWFPETRKKIGWLAGISFFVLISQALLGAVVVFFHLKAIKVALHLITAFFFTSLLLWMLMKLIRPAAPEDQLKGKNPMLKLAVGTYLIVAFQIFSGGLMAGSLAGFQMNTWPLMGDYWVPPNMMVEGESFWWNFTENKVFIQFFHRWFAFATVIVLAFLVMRSLTVQVSRVARWGLRAVLAIVVLQTILGILTLVMGVHTHLALTHQSVGLILLLNVLLVVYETKTQPVLAEEALADLEEQQALTGAEAKANA